MAIKALKEAEEEIINSSALTSSEKNEILKTMAVVRYHIQGKDDNLYDLPGWAPCLGLGASLAGMLGGPAGAAFGLIGVATSAGPCSKYLRSQGWDISDWSYS